MRLRTRIGLLTLVALAIGGALLAVFLWHRGDSEGNEDSAVVYFTHPQEGASANDLLSETLLSKSHGRTVSSFNDLMESGAVVVILDESTIAEVPSAWLEDQFRNGTILVALNFPGGQLISKIPPAQFLGPTADSVHEPGGSLAGVPYAAYIFEFTETGQSGQSHVDLPDGDAQPLLDRLRMTLCKPGQPETPELIGFCAA